MADFFDHELFDGYPEHFLKEFQEWHMMNPHVYELFKDYAFELLKAGRARYSARTVVERVRWHMDTQTTGAEFRINNNYSPVYGRMFLIEYPQYAAFFELRAVRMTNREPSFEQRPIFD